jgi:hypothetical protein
VKVELVIRTPGCAPLCPEEIVELPEQPGGRDYDVGVAVAIGNLRRRWGALRSDGYRIVCSLEEAAHVTRLLRKAAPHIARHHGRTMLRAFFGVSEVLVRLA